MSEQDKPMWLVKTSGHILGPYSIIKISELLRTKELVVLDEVSPPRSRWQYIRDRQEFKDVVEELRVRELKNTSDKTETLGTHADDLTGSVTETLNESFNDEMTGEAHPINFELTQEIKIGGETNASASDHISVKRYGTSAAASSQLQSFSRRLWFVTLVVVAVIIASAMIFKKHIFPNRMGEQNPQNIVVEAFRNYNLGLNRKALNLFDKAHTFDPENREIYLYLGSLIIQLDRQTVVGKRLLNEVLNFDGDNQKYAYTGIGLANLLDGELRFAEKNFDKALELDPKLTAAILNKGVVQSMTNNYSEANRLFKSTLERDLEDNVAYILLARNYIDIWEKTNKPRYLDDAEQLLLSFVEKNFDYKQEAYFLLAHIQLLKNNKSRLIDFLESALDTDPSLTELHKHDILVYREMVSWKSLLPWCEQLYQKQAEHYFAVAMWAYCQLKSGDLEGADLHIREALSRAPKHPLLLALNSYILQVVGQESAATVALGRANEANKSNYRLPLILQAWFCQRSGDDTCALENWQEVLRMDTKNLQAIVNIATLRAKSNNFLNMKDSVFTAYSLSKHYIPLLELNDVNKIHFSNKF